MRRARAVLAASFLLLPGLGHQLPAAAAAQQTPPPPDRAVSPGTRMRVRLLAPLTTKFNRKGDIVSAMVIEPADLTSAILEGEIREVKPGPKSSYLQFDWHTLHAGAKPVPVSAAVLEIFNRARQAGRDDFGSAVETAKAGGGGVRTAATVRRRRSAEPVRVTAPAPQLVFQAGSEFVLEVDPRGRD